ncbi:MAG TPA: acyl carrier protein [Chitinophagaceae bacterium]|nr:acyl carrier protein [Chitinophagaceae bacterium]
MERATIISTINAFLEEDFEVPASKIHPEANLKETLDLDSLDYVDLVVSIESHFGFKVKPEDFQKMVTMDDFYTYVVTKLSDKIEA